MRALAALLLVLLQLPVLVPGGLVLHLCTGMGLEGVVAFGSCCEVEHEREPAPTVASDARQSCDCCTELETSDAGPARPPAKSSAGASIGEPFDSPPVAWVSPDHAVAAAASRAQARARREAPRAVPRGVHTGRLPLRI